MCTLSEPAAPSSTAQALAMVRAGLGYLTSCDAAELSTPVQAEALIGLEQAEAQHTAARARLLAVFSAQQGHQADGQYGPAAQNGPVQRTSPFGTGCTCPIPHRNGPGPLHPATRERLQHTLLSWSIDLLSGPAGFPAYLRRHLLPARFTSLSQPLDLGRTTRIVPPHLRKAVIQRDKKCRFPGCEQPPSVCQVHHLIPWAQGGATALGNLALFCRYHHIIVIHRWGWEITCHPDGTTTATAPDGRILHSHGPPTAVA